MIEFTIPCSTFLRLHHVALQPDDKDKRDWLRCIRFEVHKENLIALTSCGNLIAVELIAGNMGEDTAFCVTIEPEMIAFVERGAAVDDVLIISPAPGWTVARLSGGAMYVKNAEWPGADQWPAWRDLLPADLPKKALGVMAFTGKEIDRIAKTSPSGTFACPKYVDPVHPVVVRDVHDPHWIGIFKVNQSGIDESFEPATIPDWVR